MTAGAGLEIIRLESEGAPFGTGLHAALRAEWQALVKETSADACFLPEWTDAWWASYGPTWARGRRPATLVLRPANGGPVEAILPFCLETLRLGPLPIRIARLAGADPSYALMRLPVRSGRRAEALAAASRHLLEAEGRDLVSFSPLSGLSEAVEALREAAADESRLTLARDEAPREHIIQRLPESFEDYLSGLSKSRRSEYRRGRNKLEKAMSVACGTLTDADATAFLDDFISLHQAQWRAVGKSGHFGDWPGSAAFYRRLCAGLEGTGAARIYVQCGDGAPLAAQLCFVQGDLCHARLTARSVDPDLEPYGVGRYGLYKRIESLIGEGVRLMETGAGEYEHKLSQGGELKALRRMVLARNGLISQMRLRLLLIWADLLNLAYYRGWFLKFAPHLAQRFGLQRGALWKSWIRTRL